MDLLNTQIKMQGYFFTTASLTETHKLCKLEVCAPKDMTSQNLVLDIQFGSHHLKVHQEYLYIQFFRGTKFESGFEENKHSTAYLKLFRLTLLRVLNVRIRSIIERTKWKIYTQLRIEIGQSEKREHMTGTVVQSA